MATHTERIGNDGEEGGVEGGGMEVEGAAVPKTEEVSLWRGREGGREGGLLLHE